MVEERPRFERCISTLADCTDHVDTPRSPQQSQDPQQETEDEPEKTAVDLANELIDDIERSLLNMTNVVTGMATDEFQNRRLLELSLELYQCHKQTLD